MINDVVINAGDTMTLHVTVKDLAGARINLTGATIKWGLSKSPIDPALITKSVGSGITLTEAALGVFDINITSADTLPYGKKDMHHETRVSLANGAICTVMSGKFTVKPSIVSTL